VNVSALANTAYAPSAAGVQSPREIEYRMMARVTGALMAAQDARNHVMMAQALTDNVRLWTAFATDVASPDNALPQSLRKSVAELAVFTLRHTLKVYAGEARVDALIDINQSVMKGLRGLTETPS
jgi:flagellar protein FlaF